MRTIFSFLLAVSAFLAASTAATAHPAHHRFPVTITDDLGTRVHLVKQPRRILSLDPAHTELLFALGLEKRLVGDGSKYDEGAEGFHMAFKYPSQWPSPWGRNYPVLAPRLTHIEGGCCGTPWNIEAIDALRPDLIVSLNSDLPSIAKMRSLGLKVLVLDPSNIAGILHDVTLLGRATGEEAHAAVVVANMRKDVSAVTKAIVKTRSRPRVYYEIDASDPTEPYLAGKGTFIDQVIHLAGGANVADHAGLCSGKTCYPQVNLETLITLNPQIIVLGDSAYGTSPSEVRSRSGWSTIAAVQHNRVYPFDDDLVSRDGPRIVIGLKAMAKLIHPGAFK
ncbi:MAG TPA: ABC transporter substrate-binding protein [Chloroflexota bacterium]|nr:ABC transporter substrate-binding protein [Chloroflexota bacterium]